MAASSTSVSFRIREFQEEPHLDNDNDNNAAASGDTRGYLVTTTNTTTTSSSFTVTSILEDDSTSSSSSSSTTMNNHAHSLFTKLQNTCRSVAYDLFLPLNYPHSVRQGYLEYQLYDSLQGLCSYLRGVLCSAQVLQAAGVGNEHATALGAALTWALKDGLAMMGGLVFSYGAAPLFDAHVKEFRLFADLINDVGLFLDFVAPYVVTVTVVHTSDESTTMVDPTRLLLITSTATLCKTLCGMSAAATKASITQYFAQDHGNMADLNAKESTQETLVSLLGMMMGVVLAKQLQQYEERMEQQQQPTDNATTSMAIQWIVFTVLTLVHVWANWMGVCLLRLPTLNRERAEVTIAASLLQTSDNKNNGKNNNTATQPMIRMPPDHDNNNMPPPWIPSPLDVNESLLSSTWKMLLPGRLRLNARLPDLLLAQQRGQMILDATALWSSSHQNDNNNKKEQQQRRYVLAIQPPSSNSSLLSFGSNNKCLVHICLLWGADNEDEIKAFVHAFVLLKQLDNENNSTAQHVERLLHETRRQLEPWFRRRPQNNANGTTATGIATTQLTQSLQQKGWDVMGRLYLGFSQKRTEWTRVTAARDTKKDQ